MTGMQSFLFVSGAVSYILHLNDTILAINCTHLKKKILENKPMLLASKSQITKKHLQRTLKFNLGPLLLTSSGSCHNPNQLKLHLQVLFFFVLIGWFVKKCNYGFVRIYFGLWFPWTSHIHHILYYFSNVLCLCEMSQRVCRCSWEWFFRFRLRWHADANWLSNLNKAVYEVIQIQTPNTSSPQCFIQYGCVYSKPLHLHKSIFKWHVTNALY